jgi:hypothetical protein
MRSSLIVLAVILATLRVVQVVLMAARGERAEVGRKRSGKSRAAGGDRRSSRFTEWRYYGFSNHSTDADASVAEPSEVVASSPEVGSVVSILPDGCVTTVVNGRVYRQCGSVWYQRQYAGSDVTYVVVRAP